MVALYVYRNQRISKRTFKDNYLRNMMESCYHCGRFCAPISQARGSEVAAVTKAPTLTEKLLNSWVIEQFELFFLFLKFIMSQKHNHVVVNPLAQALYNGGTLENGKKYQALSLQFIGTNQSRNFVTATVFASSKYGKATKLHEIFKSLTIAHTGFDTKYLWGQCVDDGSAQKVTVLESVEESLFSIHNGDKFGASAVYKLIQTKMKVSINPFPQGNDLISKAHKLETHFFYGSGWYEQLWKIENTLSGAHGEWFNICLDLNGNFISPRQSIFYSTGRNIIFLKSFTMSGNTHSVEDQKPEYWETLFDMGAVLNCTNILTTQAHYDTEFIGALSPLIQHTLMTSLCYNSLSVIDTARVTKIPTVSRIEKLVSELINFGKETLRRVQLKSERRFCGNYSEVFYGAPVVKSCHNMITSQQYRSNIRSQHISA